MQPLDHGILRAYLILVVSLVAIATVGGGWWILGRVDPMLALPGMGWSAALFAIFHPHPDKQVASIATLLLTFLFAVACSLLANRLPLMQLLVFGVAGWLVLAAAISARRSADKLVRRSGRRRLAVVGLTFVSGLLVQWASWPLVNFMYEPAASSDRDLLIELVTSLPLHAGGSITERLAGGAPTVPFLLSLRRHAQVAVHDSIMPDMLRPGHVLLLAHPRAMRPEELVAIDSWVRRGGRAAILADGLLSWPSPYPLGDSRNPPVTSMLGPLLTHWGLELDAPTGLASNRVVIRDLGVKVAFESPGHLVATGNACHVSKTGLIADCRIGEGRVLVVADSDLLNASAWMPYVPADGHGTEANWSASNPHWLIARLDNLTGISRRPALARPVWVR